MADVSADNALHEAAHATVARLLGIPVVEASAVLPSPCVRTRHRIAELEKITMVDLAGLCVDTTPEAIETDLANAKQHAQRLVRMRHGLALDELDAPIGSRSNKATGAPTHVNGRPSGEEP